jgi:hypothetical protein
VIELISVRVVVQKPQGQKRLGNVRVVSIEFAYTPLTSAWQDCYLDGVFFVPVHAVLPEQDLVLINGACAVGGLTKGAI